MKTETRTFYQAAVERTVLRITETLDEALDLAALARGAALSSFHFHRIFRGMMGETPLEMHRRLRLERAAWQLLARDTAVTTIAFEAGYETHEAFTRAFRAAYGSSPSAFRQGAAEIRSACERPQQIELAARSGVHFRHEPAKELLVRFLIGEVIMNVTIEEMPELRVAAIRHVGPYDRISEAFARLGGLAAPAGLFQAPGLKMLAIYHDDPETTAPEQLQSDAGITVGPGVRVPDGAVEVKIPAGRYAHATHVGPYTELGDCWSRLMGGWLPQSGHRVGSGPAYEVYRNNPTNAAPHELTTDLYLSLA
ncbi:AraC family transcriptional regulator [Pendulispora brunnea]|uniref:AraC family transcriptional regulator n=1 Tax=Pendulispora brunnea TaxID=2905690 RepID=A0ABZ2K3F4_9BACT